MKILLWIVQILLAVAFAFFGFAKLATPIDELGAQMEWVLNVSPALVRFIGIVEVAGAIGLILPMLLRILPILTPLAGVGLAIVMLAAALFHLNRGEFGNIVFNVVLFVLATFVAYGRWKLVPATARASHAS